MYFRFSGLSQYYLKCQLNGEIPGIFNATVTVTENYGNSIIDRYYITPDERFYNFETFADITDVSPNEGSDQGGTQLKIKGKYLYHSNAIPAQITIASESIKDNALLSLITFMKFILRYTV